VIARERQTDPIPSFVGAQIALNQLLAERPTLRRVPVLDALRAFDNVAQRVGDGVDGEVRTAIVAAATDALVGYLRAAIAALYQAGMAGGALDAPSFAERKAARRAARGALLETLKAVRMDFKGDVPPVLRPGTADHVELVVAFDGVIGVADGEAAIMARADWLETNGYDPDECAAEPTPISGRRVRRDGGDGGRPGKRGDEHLAIEGTSCYLGDDCIYELRGGREDGEDVQRVVLSWRPYVLGSTYIEGDDSGKRVTFRVALKADGSDVRPVLAPTVKDATCWEHWPEASGYAGRRERDMLYNAVLTLTKQLPRTIGYNATGWHQIDGRSVYLSGGACIGASGPVEGITVQLTGVLARYRLPEPPPTDSEEARAALRAAVDLLDVAPLSVMAPLCGAAWLAPLREALGEEAPDSTLWLHGPSGAFKTELSALAQAHYGPFTADTLPANFADTGPGQEKVLHGAKDAYVAVEDYHPAHSPADAAAMAKTAQRLLRSVGNGTGRNLSTREGGLREGKPPRCVPSATGELLPDGHSSLARAFAVPVEPGAVDATRLTVAQDRRDELAVALAIYIRRLAGRMDDDGPDSLPATLPHRYRALRAAAQQEGGHARGPGQVAHLYLGLETFLEFARDAGALDVAERDALLAGAWEALVKLAADQAAELAGEAPVERFMALLGDGLASKRAYLTGEDGGAPDEPLAWGWEPDPMNAGQYRHGAGVRLGVVTGEWILLIPEETHRYVVTAASAAGEVFPVKLQTLTKRLDEAGLIQTEAGTRQRTVREVIDGKRRRVIKLARTRTQLSKSESSESSESKTPDLSVDEPDFVDSLGGDGDKVSPQSESTAGEVSPQSESTAGEVSPQSESTAGEDTPNVGVGGSEEWDDAWAVASLDGVMERIHTKGLAAGLKEPHPRHDEIEALVIAAKAGRGRSAFECACHELEVLYDPEPEQGGLFVEGELPPVPEKPRDRDRERERGWS